MTHLQRRWSAPQWFTAAANVVWLSFLIHTADVVAVRHPLRDGLVVMPFRPPVTVVLVAVFVVVVGEHVGVALHELGHGVLAVATGAGVKAVDLGQGRSRLHLHLAVRGRRVCLTLRAYPGPGGTWPRRTVSAGAAAWVTAGGPLADLAGLVLLLPGLAPVLRGTQPLGLGAELVVGLALTQGSRLLRNAVPRMSEGRPNDGAKLFRPAGRALAGNAAPTPYETWEDGVRASNIGDPGPALELTGSLLAQSAPGSDQHRELSAAMAVHLGRSGRFVEAVRHLDVALDATADSARRRLLRCARADAVLSDAVLSGLGLSSAQCLELRRDIDPELGPEHRHTSALLHLVEGRPGEAAREAMVALQAATALPVVDRAAVAATIAIGLARDGDRAHARQWSGEVPAWSAWRPAVDRALAD